MREFAHFLQWMAIITVLIYGPIALHVNGVIDLTEYLK
jgi:hypothetical protein